MQEYFLSGTFIETGNSMLAQGRGILKAVHRKP